MDLSHVITQADWPPDMLKEKEKPPEPAPPAPTMAAAKVSAMDAALRQRKRAASGGAGRVTTGTPTLLQQRIGATGTPRTLIGS